MNVFVGNLAWDVDDATLWSLFERFGVVTGAKVVTDCETGRSCGYGFVEMASDEEAWSAIELLNGSEFQGCTLTVSESETCAGTFGTEFSDTTVGAGNTKSNTGNFGGGDFGPGGPPTGGRW